LTSELRSWFLRNVLEATERQLGALAVAGLRTRLPPRLSPHASLDRLRASAALDSVPLDEGEEILLAVDALLGDGSGKLLENIGTDLATRVLTQGGGVARAGDLFGTVARMQAFLEHPFVGVPLVFELRRNTAGFSLTVGVTGHSRATRALRHLAIGAIVAAERFAREAGAENLKIFAENIGDRSNISARYLPAEEFIAEEAAPVTRRPPPTRAPGTSLSEEVERILRSSAPPRKTSDPSQLAARATESRSLESRSLESRGPESRGPESRGPELRAPESSRARASLAPPRAPNLSQTELDDTLPESTTLPRSRGADSLSRTPAIKKPDLG
jgi:hypothetical protein